jgi:hypothetical protein
MDRKNNTKEVSLSFGGVFPDELYEEGVQNPNEDEVSNDNFISGEITKYPSRGEASILTEYMNTLIDTKSPGDHPYRAVMSTTNGFRCRLIKNYIDNANAVLLKYEDGHILITLRMYLAHGELTNEVSFDGGDDRFSSPIEDIFQDLMNRAIKNSKLKGGFLQMPDGEYMWEQGTLKHLDFDDIFLPPTTLNHIKHYVKIAKQKGLMLRYMLSGIPGSGKTESTRVISSVLNREMGVTIIKTNPCSRLKEKVELAKTLAPSLIVMDDIDLYLGNRNNSGYSSPNLGDFLDVLDGVNKLPENVGIIASTNAPHLVDLAAQRSGRFNRILFFGEITWDNVKGIIDKSIKHITEKDGDIKQEVYDKLTSEKLIAFFLDSKKPGAYIYETIKTIKYRIDINSEEPADISEIIEELKTENKLLEENLKTSRIEGKYSHQPKPMGFN